VSVRVHPRGVLGRRSCHEAAVDLASLAGLPPAAVLSTLVSVRQPAELATGSEIGEFASKHALAHATVEDVLTYRRAQINSEERRRAACQADPHEL
jgi:3,4-dihydroxy 2-butanone 4-phosphate synthase / GTP cyclohydrolase II